MTGQHVTRGSHSHAAARTSRFARLTALFKGHGPVPGPVADLQDHGDRMGDPFPGYDPDTEWRRARRDLPREQAHETAVDIHPHAARRFVPPGARWPDPEPCPEPWAFTLPPPPAVRLAPLPADAAERMARITYPPYGSSPKRWHAVMCQVSAATGTVSDEYPATLAPVPALDVARVTAAGIGLHRPALEAGEAAVASAPEAGLTVMRAEHPSDEAGEVAA